MEWDHFQDLNVDGRIILKSLFKTLCIVQDRDFCEHVNGTSFILNFAEFIIDK
jgi:hypothetical protein